MLYLDHAYFWHDWYAEVNNVRLVEIQFHLVFVDFSEQISRKRDVLNRWPRFGATHQALL